MEGLFLSACLQMPFLLHLTSSKCCFFLLLCTIPLQCRQSPLTHRLWKNITMWHLMTSCVRLVCVGIAEDTSQWTSPDRWTVKSSGTPGGTALEEEGGRGREQEHRDEPSTRSAGYTWYFDSSRWSAPRSCHWDCDDNNNRRSPYDWLHNRSQVIQQSQFW